MALQQYKEQLTGYIRCKIMAEWLKRGKPGGYEAFIIAVCKAKGLRYVKPKPKKL